MQLPGGMFDDLEQATVEAWVKWQDFAWYSMWSDFGSGALSFSTYAFFLKDRNGVAHGAGTHGAGQGV